MKIMSVVGARPNFMKVAPIIKAINERNAARAARKSGGNGHGSPELIQHLLVHTGQHYDRLMSDTFFEDLELPRPDVHLGVGSGSHAAQTSEIMRNFEEVVVRERPDVLVVVGDVNSTLACALVAAKISFDASGARPIIAHVESGLRSFDRAMPEEINRILTDRLADILFVTEESGLQNLAREGVPAERIHFVGNTMIDTLLTHKDKAKASRILEVLGLCGSGPDRSSREPDPYALLTLHRPANVDNRESFLNIIEGLTDLATKYPIVFPAHPRTQKRIKEFALESYFDCDWCSESGDPTLPVRPMTAGSIHVINSLGYLDFLRMLSQATLVVTDSGGIQEETTCLGVPCVTVRENTERPVTVSHGTNILGGVRTAGIRKAIHQQLQSAGIGAVPEKWDGQSAARIVEVLSAAVEKTTATVLTAV